MNKNKIDAVILWVDGNDEKWLNEKKKYSLNKTGEENNSNRFRDWDNLQYWFRAIEKNAKWINQIYFVTWGHIPSWLNTDNKKLKIINHKDYIPSEYLPTYNSNVIELNLHRVKELSENFILFNDDMFIINKTEESDFFINDTPLEFYSEVIDFANKPNDIYEHTLFNNMSIINKYFSKHSVYKKNFSKYFNLKYGLKNNITTLLLARFNKFSMISNPHVPVALKKSVLKKLWDLEPETFKRCCSNRFRELSDVSQYLIRYYQMASGDFYPRSPKFGKYYALEDDNTKLMENLDNSSCKIVCFNDTPKITDFEKSKKTLNDYLKGKFPEKSSFEK